MSDPTSKIAIVCYSKAGHSLRAAERLAAALDADILPLKIHRYRMPFFGYLRAGLDSLRRAPVPFPRPLPDIMGHDAVVICGPVWTSYPAVPLINYLQQETHLPWATGLLLTNGDHSPPDKAFARAEAEFGRAFVAKAAISNDIEDKPEAAEKIAAFAQAMRVALGAEAKLHDA